MNPDELNVIGIDVGGTKIAAGVIGFPGGIVREKITVPTTAVSGSCAVLEEVRRLVLKLGERWEGKLRSTVGIGLCICEIVTRDGKIASEATLQWSEKDIQKNLQDLAFIVFEADVRAAARAEAVYGVGRGLYCFLYVSVGTGISCSLVIDGEPFLGARGATGTMASGPMPSFDLNASRTLEQVASGPALVTRYNEAAAGNIQRAEEVLAAAANGNARAIQIVESGASALGASIGWLVNVLDPEAVVLGGGLGLSKGLFHETVIDSARRHIWWPKHRNLPIIRAQTGPDAGLIGAALNAWIRSAPENWKANRPT